MAEFPEIARERRKITPPVRLHPSRAHLIVFRAEPDHLLVIRVVHGRQDWPVLMDS